MANAYNFFEGSQTDINRRLLRKIEALEAGESSETADITALKNTVGDSTKGLVKDMIDAKSAIGVDDTTAGGLKKRCKTIETAIGDNAAGEETGIYKDIADLVAAIGDESTPASILGRIKALENEE